MSTGVRANKGCVIVSGGSRGIGAATALTLATEGWRVVITYLERADAARSIEAQAARTGGEVIAIQADFGEEHDIVKLFKFVDLAIGPINGLVNNAAVIGHVGRVDELDPAVLRRTFDVNIVGCFVACREAVARLSTSRGGAGGSIVNVSSRAAVLGAGGEYVHYASSKAAIDALTIGLAREVGAEGIRVNAVRPSLIDTEIHLPGRLQELSSQTALGRPGRADEVAGAIRWLMSEEASYVTGAVLDVSAGR